MLNANQHIVKLLAVLRFPIEELYALLRVVDGLSRYVWGLGLSVDVVCQALGAENVFLERFGVLDPGGNFALGLLVYCVYLRL